MLQRRYRNHTTLSADGIPSECVAQAFAATLARRILDGAAIFANLQHKRVVTHTFGERTTLICLWEQRLSHYIRSRG